MSDFQKIEYLDLGHEFKAGRLPSCIGRTEEISRITRTLSRNLSHHVVIVGAAGTGKTQLLYGAAQVFLNNPNFSKLNVVMLNSTSLQKVGGLPQSSIAAYQEAFLHLNSSIILLDNFGSLVTGALQNWMVILQPLLAKKNLYLILTSTPEQSLWMQKNAPQFWANFGLITIEEQPEQQQIQILKHAVEKFNPNSEISDQTVKSTINLIKRFPSLGTLPKAGIEILDEAMAEAETLNLKTVDPNLDHPAIRHLLVRRAQKKKITVTPEIITRVVSEKTGIPLQNLNRNEKQNLKLLSAVLNRQIIGQQEPVAAITQAIQRAKLGLRSTNKPLASFLLLGPSGVGKTETAKLLAENLYGRPESFLRIDMSEFGEAHTIQRLIGAPPGYAGFDSGGQLTNHLSNFPYSLILLDEVEKAHAKIFDIFLQLLDDGRLTSGQGKTVDATQTVVMATSNLCVDEIISCYQAGGNIHDPSFLKNNLVPILSKYFRVEFLNRFDGILIYNPLSAENLTDIALLEIKKIEARVKEHNIKFSITREVLEQKVKTLCDPRFGARPVKRFVEEMCENLIAEQLLK